jgi:very-short-patch-repair endonuclease
VGVEVRRSDTLNKAIATHFASGGHGPRYPSEPLVRSDASVALATRQHTAISLAQLTALGFSARAVQKRASGRRLYRVHPGVYSMVPPELLTRRGRWMAAVLACGEGAVLSHCSAAALHELRAAVRSRIDVTVPQAHHRKVKGVNVHRSRRLTVADVTVVDEIPCTTVARTILDLAGVVDRRSVERAIEQADIQRVLDYRGLRNQVERNQNTRAACRLRSVLADQDDRSAPTESELEERFLALCRATGLPLPERQVHINPDDGEPPVRVDFAWRAPKLIVETDGGRYHRTRRAFESDRRKDQRLQLAGWLVLRITWRQLRDEPERVANTIARALRQQ